MIIFDLDDTLIDTTGSIAPVKLERALNILCNEGLQLDNKQKALKTFTRINQTSSSSKEALKKFLQLIKADDKFLSIGLREIYHGSLEGIAVKPLDSAMQVLTRLSPKHTLSIVTVGDINLQMEKLKKGGIDTQLFKKILVISEKNKGPQYQKMVEEFNVKPESVIVCGDRIILDLLPGKQLGYHTVHMKWGRGLNCIDSYKAVDYTVNNLDEFEDLIQGMVST